MAVPVAVAGNARRTSSSSVRYFSRPYVTAAAYRASRAAGRIDLDHAEERRHRHGLLQHVRVLPSSDLTTLCGIRLSPTHRIEAEQIQTAAAPIRSHDPTSEVDSAVRASSWRVPNPRLAARGTDLSRRRCG